MKKILVITPTYNEAGNIKKLIAGIFKSGAGTGRYDYEVLVVDDESPDGTAKIVKSIQRGSSKVHLISGQKKGLGSAYIRGLKYGLKRNKYDTFVLMDADLSHSPGEIHSLLNAIGSGADYAIGSRYIKGGAFENWPMRRKFSSLAANLLAKTLLDIKDDIKDLTGGFKAIKVSSLKSINLDELKATGYAFQVNLLYEFSRRGLKIKEVPITFTNRQTGKSKMHATDVLKFAYQTYRLNPRSRARRIIRFGLVGASGTIVNIGVLILLVNLLDTPVLIAGALAIEASIISNFFFNHHYTFGDWRDSSYTSRRDSARALAGKLVRYNLVALGGAAISYLVFAAGYKWLGFHYVLADIIAILVAMSWNYYMSVRVVWKIVDE